VLGGLQGLAFAATLVTIRLREPREITPWTWDIRTPAQRAAARRIPTDRIPPEARIALWPGVQELMRIRGRASTDLADAGYRLATAWTKQRTMFALVEDSVVLFNQSTELPRALLCDAKTVRFLQLSYLLAPRRTLCAPWTAMPGVVVDGTYDVGIATDSDRRVRALPAAALTGVAAHLREQALSRGSFILAAMAPVADSSLEMSTGRIEIGLPGRTAAENQVLLVPVAHDPGWHTSSGRIRNVGGLLAVDEVRDTNVTLTFRPDAVMRVRALALTAAQGMGLVGFVGLAWLVSSSPGRKRLGRS
jgi:hypothetical protein